MTATILQFPTGDVRHGAHDAAANPIPVLDAYLHHTISDVDVYKAWCPT